MAITGIRIISVASRYIFFILVEAERVLRLHSWNTASKPSEGPLKPLFSNYENFRTESLHL
jgi:hypothetical protein